MCQPLVRLRTFKLIVQSSLPIETTFFHTTSFPSSLATCSCTVCLKSCADLYTAQVELLQVSAPEAAAYEFQSAARLHTRTLPKVMFSADLAGTLIEFQASEFTKRQTSARYERLTTPTTPPEFYP